MVQKDMTETKGKIVSILESRGPSLPIHVSKGVGMDMLFASAFLSELLSEKRVKITSMKIGSSPLYFIAGQEAKLEGFSHHLKSREKDAFDILKSRKFLLDKEQEPAIRVALRTLKDFAFPFKFRGDIYWRYFLVPQSDFQRAKPVEVVREVKKVDVPMKEEKIKVVKKKTAGRTGTSSGQSNKFFERVKEVLSGKQADIVDILSVSKECLVLQVTEKGENYVVVAYNKKRINEKDIMDAYKKVSDPNMKYKILSLGEPLKKLVTFIDAIKSLAGVEKV